MKRSLALSVVFLVILTLTGQALADNDLMSAEQLFSAQEYKKAIGHLKKATRGNPSSLEAWVLMGKCYTALGKEKKAMKTYEKAVQIDPDHEEAVFLLGLSYSRLDEHWSAIEAFKKVIAINPEHAQARFSLGVSHDHIGRLSDAWEQYKVLKTLDQGLADELRHIILK